MLKLIITMLIVVPLLADHIDKDAQIVNYQADSHPDGSYQYAFETTNGIVGQEQGVGGVGASGSSQYVAPDGQVIKLTYTADENGFIAQGSHVPLIPEAILRSLEWNKAHPEEDDYLHPELNGGGGGGAVQGLPAYTTQLPPSAQY